MNHPVTVSLTSYPDRVQERQPDWPTDVDARITYGIDVGKDRGFIHKGDLLVVVTGWKQGYCILGSKDYCYLKLHTNMVLFSRNIWNSEAHCDCERIVFLCGS